MPSLPPFNKVRFAVQPIRRIAWIMFFMLIAVLINNPLQALAAPEIVATMPMNNFSHVVSAPFFGCITVVGIPITECNALIALYNSTNGPSWTNHMNWGVTSMPCNDWYDVSCSGGHVVRIYLPNNNLRGTLPSLSGLTNLQGLELFHNHLTGWIPSLNGLASLQVVELSDNQLNGPIPSLNGLTNLQALYLSKNQLSGLIPSLNGLTNLQTFSVYENQLSGTLAPFNQLSNLTALYLNNNRFIGSAPDLPASLLRFDISNNLLNGIIPNSLANTAIAAGQLMLCGTGNILTPANASVNVFITAHLPGWIGYCGPPVTHFSVSGFPSPITTGIAGTAAVTALDASNNIVAVYNGTVAITSSDANAVLPANAALINGVGMFSVTLNTAGPQTITATDTTISTNIGTQSGITVSAPVTNCAAVVEISMTECNALLAFYTSTNGAGWMNHNNWTVNNTPCTNWFGIYCSSGHVVDVALSGDNLSGTIPLLSELTNLQGLDLSRNQLNGTIPLLSGLTNLQTLDLSRNQLSGTIPSLSGLINLQTVYLYSNQLSGTIPLLSGLINLQTFSLSHNQLSGTIPPLSGLANLSNFLVDDNQLGGTIPSLNGLTHLGVLQLAQNQLGGTIPSLSGLLSLQHALVNANQFTGSVPDLPMSLTDLNVSSNLLNGIIPNSLTSTAVLAGQLALCGTGNTLTPLNASVNTFVTERLSGWTGYCGSPVMHFSVSGFPSPIITGVAGTVTITALDALNSVGSGYSGTVVISSSDPQAILPANATLTNGVGMFSVTLKTLGTQMLTATDTAIAAISGTQASIMVTVGTTTNFAVSGYPTSTRAGTTANITVTAKDTYGNTVTDYTDLVKISSSDPQAILPANAVLTNGVGTFSVALNTVGTQTITAMDVASAMISGTQSGIVVTAGNDTVGIYRTSNNTFYLRNSNVTGVADITIQFGSTDTSYPIVGDWNGDGIDTIGIYETTSAQFSLRDSNTAGTADYTLTLGYPGDQPIAGRWTSDMTHAGVGVFRPSNGILYLKKNLTTGFADFYMVLGVPGDIGIAGDWNGDGMDSPGVFRPTSNTFFLTDKVTQGPIFGDYSAVLGYAGDQPIVGDWIGQGHAGIGVFRPSDGQIYLKNILITGFADTALVYGIPNDIPVAGHWATVSSMSASNALNSLIVPNTSPLTATPTPANPLVTPLLQHDYDG